MLKDPPVFSEKRAAHRARRLLQATCVFNEGKSVLDVTLRDISPAGARIAGHELIYLPKTFELRVHDRVGGYSSRKARLIWTDGATAGLEFID
jgi:PilZ domain